MAWLFYDGDDEDRKIGASDYLYQFIVHTVLDEAPYYDGVVWKLETPVTVQTHGFSDLTALRRIDGFFAELEKYSGLEIRRVPDNEAAMIAVVHKPGKVLEQTIGFLRKEVPEDSPVSSPDSCVGLAGRFSRPNLKAVIGLSSDLAPDEKLACFKKQMVRSIGFRGDRYWWMPNVFDSVLTTGWLTRSDRFVLRTLYDDRIQSQMTGESLNEAAWRIISDLFAEFENRGDAALLHPSYLARPNSGS